MIVTGDEGIIGHHATAAKDTSLPVEYVGHGGMRVARVSLYKGDEGLMLKGRIEVDNPSTISTLRIVKIEAVNADGQIVWSVVAGIEHEHGARWHRRHTGTFATAIPDLSGIDHLHIGVTSTVNEDGPLISDRSQGGHS